MKKYNLSEIMTKAWAIRRELLITMSAALKKAWALAKETKKMLGTEKQVKWATEIRSNIVKTFESAAVAEPQLKNVIQPYIDRLIADDMYAGDIIDLFKGIRFNGDLQHDLPGIMSVYRVAVANTAGQHAILGR